MNEKVSYIVSDEHFDTFNYIGDSLIDAYTHWKVDEHRRSLIICIRADTNRYIVEPLLYPDELSRFRVEARATEIFRRAIQ